MPSLRLLRTFAYATLIAIALLASSAHDAHARGFTCGNAAQTLITLPSIKAAADAPIGTVFWRQDNINFTVNCSAYAWIFNCDACQAYLYRQNLSIPNTGLSLVLTYRQNTGSSAATIDTGTAVTLVNLVGGNDVSGTVSLTLQKTGTTPSSGTISQDSLLAFQIADADRHEPGTFTVRGLSNVQFVSNTCDVDTSSRNITVPMGTARYQDFTGIGSTAAAQSVPPIRLNCSSDLAGTYNVAVTFNGTADPSGAPGVIALTQEAAAATGVGIQLLTGGVPVTLGTPIKVGVTPSSTINIPLTARYYQTAKEITGGKANGIATFVVSYK